MPNSTPGLIEAAIAVLAKLWPGMVGGVIALKFHQDQTTFLGRAFVLLASIALSAVFGPALNELLNVETPYLQSAISSLVALFGLFVIGEVIQAIQEIKLGEIIGDFVRRLLGVGGKK